MFTRINQERPEAKKTQEYVRSGIKAAYTALKKLEYGDLPNTIEMSTKSKEELKELIHNIRDMLDKLEKKLPKD